MFNRDANTSFDAMNTIITRQANPTDMPDLYYYETAFDKYTYITERIITDPEGSKLGYFFIVSTPRKYSSGDALFPELFKQYKENCAGEFTDLFLCNL